MCLFGLIGSTCGEILRICFVIWLFIGWPACVISRPAVIGFALQVIYFKHLSTAVRTAFSRWFSHFLVALLNLFFWKYFRNLNRFLVLSTDSRLILNTIFWYSTWYTNLKDKAFFPSLVLKCISSSFISAPALWKLTKLTNNLHQTLFNHSLIYVFRELLAFTMQGCEYRHAGTK